MPLSLTGKRRDRETDRQTESQVGVRDKVDRCRTKQKDGESARGVVVTYIR